MEKTTKKIKQFPKISRLITEQQNLFILVVSALVFLFTIFMLVDLRQKVIMTQTLRTEKEQVLKNIKKWEETVGKYKDYRDGYFELSILEYRLGNIEKAREYLEKTFVIDPNFKQGREFEKILTENY